MNDLPLAKAAAASSPLLVKRQRAAKHTPSRSLDAAKLAACPVISRKETSPRPQGTSTARGRPYTAVTCISGVRGKNWRDRERFHVGGPSAASAVRRPRGMEG